MTSSGEQVSRSSTSNHEIEMRFFVPTNESELMIGWYGNRSGDPQPLNGTIYPDDNGTISLDAPARDVPPVPDQVSHEHGLADTARLPWQLHRGLPLDRLLQSHDRWVGCIHGLHEGL